MQALILVAGLGKRLRPITNNKPKCLVEIGGETFLQRMIQSLLKCGIKDINIITGYQAQKVEVFVSKTFPNLNVQFYHNVLYMQTNNCYSLWLGRDCIHEDFLLLDGDIIFDDSILKGVIESLHQNVLVLRKTKDLSHEEMKVEVNKKGEVLEISKEMMVSKADGESIGIEKLSYSFSKKLFNKLDENITKKELRNDFYEKSFNELIQKGERMNIFDVGDLKCAEVDCIEDIEYIEKYVLPFIDKLL